MTDRLQHDIELQMVAASKGHIFTHDSSTNMPSVFARLSLPRQEESQRYGGEGSDSRDL